MENGGGGNGEAQRARGLARGGDRENEEWRRGRRAEGDVRARRTFRGGPGVRDDGEARVGERGQGRGDGGGRGEGRADAYQGWRIVEGVGESAGGWARFCEGSERWLGRESARVRVRTWVCVHVRACILCVRTRIYLTYIYV